MNLGGGGRDRTDDLLLAKQTLSQLSYTPKVASIRAHLYRDFEILPLSNGLILRILIICNMLSIIKFSLPLVVDIRLLFWCLRSDSNRYTFRREILSLLCLPISPPRHLAKDDIFGSNCQLWDL